MALTDTYLEDTVPFPDPASSSSWGDRDLLIDFVGGPYHVTGLNPAQARELSTYFEQLVPASRDRLPAVSTIRVMPVGPEIFRALPPPPRPLGMALESGPCTVRIASESMCGLIDLSGHQDGCLWTDARYANFRHSDFQNFLRVFVAYRLTAMGGMLLHSAGVVSDGRAYLFPGRSGDGKSTFSRLSLGHGKTVLSDDLNALTWHEGRPFLEKVPFTGDLGRSPSRSDRYPLAGVLRLVKHEQTAVTPLQKSQALALLFSSASFLNADPNRADYLLDRLNELLSSVPAHNISFNTRDNPWPLIERAMGSASKEIRAL